MNELALFAGAGGGILGGHLLGWRTVCAVEQNPYAASILIQRQNDGMLPAFPVWDDVRTFDGNPWAGIVDVVSGGFPCQDISNSGEKAGITGERSGLWSEMSRIISEVRPRFVFVENVAALLGRGMGVVLGDLAALGFDARWGVLGGVHVSAPQSRERVWIVANAKSERRGAIFKEPGILQSPQENSARPSRHGWFDHGQNSQGILWPPESGLVRVADGMARRVDRIKAAGNGQIPRVAATAFSLLSGATSLNG